VLSREAILDAALDLVDEVGPGNLTMRGLAQRLGVTAAAIYYYFDGRDQLVEALLDEVCLRIVARYERVGSWQDQLCDLLRAMVDHAVAHPTASMWAVTTYARQPPMLRLHEAILEILGDAGFDPETATQIKGAALRFCIGHLAMSEARPGHAWRQVSKRSFPRYYASGPALDRFDPAEHFELGLRALLRGLDVTFRSRSRRSRL
jgi:AcrR family transcriptional regulator